MANTQKQHVQQYRKIAIRRSLLPLIGPGAAYVPFVGDGDIACELYADRDIWAADLDPARVSTARGRLPRTTTVVVADCDGWPFPGCAETFAVADCDAYANPYKAMVAFARNAKMAPRILVIGTDGMRRRMKFGFLKSLPGGAETEAPLSELRKMMNFWWPRHVRPFIESTFSRRIIAERKYNRGVSMMLYWGVVLE